MLFLELLLIVVPGVVMFVTTFSIVSFTYWAQLWQICQTSTEFPKNSTIWNHFEATYILLDYITCYEV